jgi:nitroimidazol reductase NimA-like FMN-containing flavoprotein (pyridoxamine 5'-phosphate oxidase superfamily)
MKGAVDMRGDIKKLIQENHVCVLATVSEGEPHCSLMSYAADEDCREIYMATHKDTKKYRNLAANPSVSLLIDSRETGGKDKKAKTKALTVTGTFQDGMDEQRRTAVRKALLERHPDLNEFFTDPAAEIIVVKVKALQLLDGITDAYFEKIS